MRQEASASDSGEKVIQRRVKTGCFTCRKRHMKCDERRPKCRHCEIAGRSCTFPLPPELAGLPVPDSDDASFDFPSDHVWVEVPASLRFVHQVQHARQDPEEDTTDPLPRRTADEPTYESSPLAARDFSGPTEPRITTPSNHATSPTAISPHAPVQPPTYFSPGAISDGQGTSRNGDSPALSLHSAASIYIARPRVPLEDPQRAQLLRHYVDNVSGWLDVNDPRHHFSIAVPHLAMTCPMLLDAIFALSARDLSRVTTSATATPSSITTHASTVTQLVADDYHDSCVHRLIPALQDLSLAAESALPISVVILRMHEMLCSGGANETDFQRHLQGCVSLFRHNRNRFRPGSLQHTAFWAYVRQEILTALQGGSPTHIDTSDRTYYVVFWGQTDDEWTNHITWLAAQVINYCFDSGARQAPSAGERWQKLRKDVDAWRDRLPDTFRPLSVIVDDEPFPAISYLCTWHVVGMQFYHLCMVLLALHYPVQNSGTGIDLLRLMRFIETEIAEHTSQQCGIVRGLTASQAAKYPGTLVNAVELLVVCGRTLKTRPEQLAVLRMLRDIETITAWPVERATKILQTEWDM